MYVAVVAGSPSASDLDRESDADRELNDLRARAYGPHPDIEADPAALARLIDLEAAHILAAVAAPEIASDVATAERSRAWLVAAWIVMVVIVVVSLVWLLSPRPDATLHLVEDETDGELLGNLDVQGRPDVSTLRHFEPYHDVDVWSVENGVGYVCLIAFHRHSGRFETQCAPPATELAIYLVAAPEGEDDFGDWLPSGSSVSFRLRDDTVDVDLHPPQAPD